MKICMIGLEIAASKEGVFVGGAVNSVIRLSQGLSQKHHQIGIVTTPSRFLYDSNFNVPWANVLQIPVGGICPSMGYYGFEFLIKTLTRIKRAHKKEEFQIIHGHSGYPVMGLVSGIAGKIIDTPSVHTLYCPVNSKNWFAKFYLSRIDMIVAISENVKKSLERIKIPTQKIKVIPPPIDTAAFNPSTSGKEIREKLKIDKNDKVILFVGNFKKNKGIDVLIDAMKIVVEKHSDAKLLIKIDIPTENKFDKRKLQIEAKIESCGLKDNVIHLCQVKEISQLMAACDMFVCPFLSTEGPADYPLSLLEGMAVGKPVIATKVGGIPEIISSMENGILVEPEDVNSLSNAIITLLEDDKLRHELGKEASTFVLNNFSIEKITGRYEVIYEEIKRG